MKKVIGIFSGKGGVGKTTVVANLGASLSSVFNRKVVILDTNIKSSHLGLHFGLYDDLPITLGDVLKDNTPVIQAVYVHPSSGVRIVPAPLNGINISLNKGKCYSALDKLRIDYEMVLVDSAPGLGSDVMITMSAVDAGIVVTTPDIPSVTDALKTINIMRKLRKDVLGVVVNRFRNEKYELTVDEIESTCNSKIIAIVPEDKKVSEAIFNGTPVVLSHPNSSSSIQLKRLAAHLIGEDYKPPNLFEKLIDIFSFKKQKPRVSKELLSTRTYLEKERKDVEGLKDGMMKESREELKEEIMKRVKERLKERKHAQRNYR